MAIRLEIGDWIRVGGDGETCSDPQAKMLGELFSAPTQVTTWVTSEGVAQKSLEFRAMEGIAIGPIMLRKPVYCACVFLTEIVKKQDRMLVFF